jgi:ABC-type multidrug transport system fused ATPase/permease subunit
MIYKYFFKYFPLIKKKFFLIFFLIFFITFLNLLKPIILTGATSFVLEDLKISNEIGLTKNNIINDIKNKITPVIKKKLPNLEHKIFFLIILIINLSLVILLVNYFFELLIIKLRQSVIINIKIDLIKKILNSDLLNFNKNKIGDLISIINNDTKSLSQGCVSFVIRNFSATVFFLIFFLYLIYIQIWMTVLLILIFLFHFLIFLFLKRLQKKYTRVSLDKYGAVFSSLNQIFINFRIIKIFNSEKYALSLVSTDLEQSLKAEIKFEKTSAIELELRKFVDSMLEILLFSICIWFVSKGKLSISDAVGYVYALKLTMSPAKELASAPLWYERIKSSAIKVDQFFKYENKIVDGKKNPKKFTNSVIFKNVSFLYNSSDKKEVINKATVTINKNLIIGIFGENGSGKSTFCDLLIRAVDPTMGDIYFDQENIKNFKIKKYRDLFSVVPQENILINATIKENILFGRNDISKKDLDKVLVDSNCKNFIDKFPDGLNTVVGERGNLISGGQKQRICIARALIKKPEFLIFDEATSNLDRENLKNLLKIIKSLKFKHTIILISHDNKCKEICDEILYLKNGQIFKK